MPPKPARQGPPAPPRQIPSAHDRQIPAEAARQLAVIALRVAARAGDASPASIEAVATTRETALTVMNSGRIPGSDHQHAFLVVMKGDFTLTRAPRPPRAKAPSGHYLWITFDTGTFQRLDLGLRNQAASFSLQRIGPVSDLTRQ